MVILSWNHQQLILICRGWGGGGRSSDEVGAMTCPMSAPALIPIRGLDRLLLLKSNNTTDGSLEFTTSISKELNRRGVKKIYGAYHVFKKERKLPEKAENYVHPFPTDKGISAIMRFPLMSFLLSKCMKDNKSDKRY